MGGNTSYSAAMENVKSSDGEILNCFGLTNGSKETTVADTGHLENQSTIIAVRGDDAGGAVDTWTPPDAGWLPETKHRCELYGSEKGSLVGGGP